MPKRESSPKRIQRQRAKGWRMPAGAVCVTRPTKWGNPFPIEEFGRDLALRLFKDAARGIWNGSSIPEAKFARAYELQDAWHRRIAGHPIDEARAELRGNDLACWCPLDQPCHADVLLELANG